MAQKTKSRQYMMVQDLNKLPYDLGKLKEILSGLKAKEWAFIVHDKDKSENGGLVKPHVHQFLSLKMKECLTHSLKL
ncbi:hypothetical protein IMAU30049_00674 [Lactobacillus helveticus]|uniref:Plasmid replication protein n=1 Tax=Lactobacillus helveticus TaxID=1587 RepID=A0A3S8SDB9_LACHE|nr:Rep family protein [Lactobacillus helveticus]AZK91788.1 Plasmid replication protein [Lactobacillus helveticus]MCJ2190790.1 replication protein [Lactobacillus helveticus]NRO50624.1 hypothetical protein [Lactobacillus helveticus]NRO68082.1 hypothetical protein [Lactobacillus helveticus]NRO69957.1 hypothetical protein [Lactobacillus helveticus]